MNTWAFHGQGTATLRNLPLGRLRTFSCIIQTRVGQRRACPRQQLLHKCAELHVTKKAERGYKLQYISNYTQAATEESDSERRYFRSQRLLRLLTFRPGGSTQGLSHRWAGLFHRDATSSSWGRCVWHPFGSHRGCQLCVPLSAVTGRQASCSSRKCFLHWEGYTAIPGFPGGAHCNGDELHAHRWPCWVCNFFAPNTLSGRSWVHGFPKEKPHLPFLAGLVIFLHVKQVQTANVPQSSRIT